MGFSGVFNHSVESRPGIPSARDDLSRVLPMKEVDHENQTSVQHLRNDGEANSELHLRL